MVQVTERIHRGLFSRLFNSIIGVAIGFVLIPVSMMLIGWNEYRTIHRAKGLIEGESVVVDLANSDNIDSAYYGKLIHAIGLATTSESLSDPEFGVSGKLLQLRRMVEMYQWVEKVESKTRKKIGGGEETVKTYSYDKQWLPGREESENFHEVSRHINPQQRFSAQQSISNHATFGAFTLRPEQVSKIDRWTEARLDEGSLLEKFDLAERERFKVEGGYVYYSHRRPDSTAPQVGDQRIRLEVVQPTQISVLGKQDQNTISPFKTSNGEIIDSLHVGQVSASEMFANLKQQNTFLAMLLRVAGWGLSVVGFMLIASPLKTLTDIVPFFGKMVGAVTFFIAVILGSCVSLITVSIAWVAVRPLYSISLLTIVCVVIFLLLRRRGNPDKTVRQQISVIEQTQQ